MLMIPGKNSTLSSRADGQNVLLSVRQEIDADVVLRGEHGPSAQLGAEVPSESRCQKMMWGGCR